MSPEDEHVGDVLEPLRRPSTPTGWREPAQLRRTALRRRRARLTGFAAAGVAAATAITLTVALPGGSGPGPAPGQHVAVGLHVADRSGAGTELVANVAPLTTTASSPAAAVARAEQAFTLALLRQVGTGTGNVVLSPSSLAVALTMLENGAAGNTRAQIATALQSSGLSLAQQNAGWAALQNDLASAATDGGVTVQSANSLWIERNLPMAPAFMKVMARYFRTGVWQVDFAEHMTAAQQALNQWVSAKTHGKITSLFGPGDLDPSTVLVLANAVYFDASWKYRFDAKLTSNAPFHSGAGNTAAVPFMRYGSKGPQLLAGGTSAYTAVQLPYQGGRFAALAIMPTGQSLTQFVGGLTPASLTTLVDSLGPQQADVRLPKFTLTQFTHLNSTLAAMGMPDAFGQAADLSAMSPTPLQVQQVVQRDYLKVDEQGTQAAAVTGIAIGSMSVAAPRTYTFDHPFLFLVRDTVTGAILFAAQIQNPAG